MEAFLARHQDFITGVLHGLDRLVLRGVLRQLSHCSGLLAFLCHRGVLLTDFADFATTLTRQVVTACEAVAADHRRPFVYLPSSQQRKEDVAREILADDPVDKGLICVLKCVEPCKSFEIHRSRSSQRLELRSVPRKCAHIYHYFLHPRFGFMHVRTQTWLPFLTQIVINGREWLVRDLQREGIAHDRRDNCIAYVADPKRAQQLLRDQLKTSWPDELDRIASTANPAHQEIFRNDRMARYWTTHQLEWATDVLFDSPDSLAALYPDLTRYAITNLGSQDVFRFLQKKLTGHFQGDATSSYKRRPEGLRVKHSINTNSIKMYDKQGSVLRVETTLNRVQDIKAFRPKEGDPDGPRSWRQCRKGVADLHRVTEIAQTANESYFQALAAVDPTKKLGELLEPLLRHARLGKQRVRGLRPWDQRDLSLLRAIGRGEFLLHGFRNRDIVAQLHPELRDRDAARRASATTGRLFRILRAHGLIRKLPRTHRYKVTPLGREVIQAVLAANDSQVSALLDAA